MDQHSADLLTADPGADGSAGATSEAERQAWYARRAGVPSVWARYTELVVERAAGSWIETIDGERYLDYTCGIGVTNTGHAHPRVAAAIAEQAGQIIHAQQNILYHKPGLALHERLPRYFPGPAGEEIGLFLSNSGAEAIEAAVKLAKIATRRPLVISFRGGFHGRTHGAMALTSSAIKNRGHFEPLPAGVHFVSYPDPLRMGGPDAALARTLAEIEQLFATLCFPDDVAAFLVEPVLGEGGYVVPPDTFVPALRRVADEHGILLIADEVQTGFGRTGRFFASEWGGAVPDILVLAKGIASGMPLSGIMARRKLLESFVPGSHGGTYGGNAVACAAALATLEVIEQERLVEAARRQGERLLGGLREVTEGREGVAEVRGRGLMVAIEFAEAGSLRPLPEKARALIAGALERRLLLLPCGTYGQAVRIIPPLNTTDDEVDLALGVLGEVLAGL